MIYTGEVFGNPAGGYRQGAIYNGLVTAGLDIDFGRLLGWQGIKFHALAYETQGANGANLYTRDLNFYSSINSYDSVRLSEVWLQASLRHNAVNLRDGQEEVDAEFATTIGGALFIHSNFGELPTLPLNVPTPTYPEAAPAARLRLNSPLGHFYFQAGVYSANAARDGDLKPGFRAGTSYDDGICFPISGNQGVLSLHEAGYLLNYRKEGAGLPGAYRVGGFYHTEDFSDEFLLSADPFLTIPPVAVRPRVHGGNGGIYAVGEQVLYRPNILAATTRTWRRVPRPSATRRIRRLAWRGRAGPSRVGATRFRPSRRRPGRPQPDGLVRRGRVQLPRADPRPQSGRARGRFYLYKSIRHGPTANKRC